MGKPIQLGSSFRQRKFVSLSTFILFFSLKFINLNVQKHPALWTEYKQWMAANSSKPGAKKKKNWDSDSAPAKRPRQETILHAFRPDQIEKKKENHDKNKRIPPDVQLRIDMRVFQFVVGDALPLRTVESVFFLNLIKEIDERVVVVCVLTLKKNIAEEFLKFKELMRIEFQSALCVCLTADIWGSKKRSFLCITAHWLVVLPDGKIVRRSAGIACKRFACQYCLIVIPFSTHLTVFIIVQEAIRMIGLLS